MIEDLPQGGNDEPKVISCGVGPRGPSMVFETRLQRFFRRFRERRQLRNQLSGDDRIFGARYNGDDISLGDWKREQRSNSR